MKVPSTFVAWLFHHHKQLTIWLEARDIRNEYEKTLLASHSHLIDHNFVTRPLELLWQPLDGWRIHSREEMGRGSKKVRRKKVVDTSWSGQLVSESWRSSHDRAEIRCGDQGGGSKAEIEGRMEGKRIKKGFSYSQVSASVTKSKWYVREREEEEIVYQVPPLSSFDLWRIIYGSHSLPSLIPSDLPVLYLFPFPFSLVLSFVLNCTSEP